MATTYEEDIVLDCFAGSGSTAVAALKHNRKSVSIEIDETWIAHIKCMLESLKSVDHSKYPDNYLEPLLKTSDGQLSLFV